MADRTQVLIDLIDDRYVDPRAELQLYAENLNLAFDHAPESHRYNGLLQDDNFSEWYRDPSSSVRLLHGCTSAATNGHSWLSHCCHPFIECYLRPRGESVALFLCRPADLGPVYFATILRVWCCQLITQRREYLNVAAGYEQIHMAASIVAQDPTNIYSLVNLLNRCIGLFNRIFLVIDRIDCIADPPENWLPVICNVVKNNKDRRRRGSPNVKFLLLCEGSVGLQFYLQLWDALPAVAFFSSRRDC